MLQSFVRGALVALTVATGFVGLGATPSSAQSVRITVDDGVYRDRVQYRDYDRRDFRDRDRRDFRDRDRFDDRRGGRCSPRLAIRKAYGIGANRPRIVRENRRVVVVDGFRRGRLVTVRFANDRGCPVLAVRR